MGWLIVFLLLMLTVAAFTRAFRRRLDLLTGPWIAKELSRHE
jgi:uncharacterized RDD family membrane protein YckC